MNYNVKRHQLLEILSIQNINVQLDKPNYKILGISLNEIYKTLNVTDLELGFLTAELYDNEEIGYHNAHNVIGLYASNKGLTSFTNKKYLKLYRREKIEKIKDVIQIIIPVLSVIVAILALTLKIENINSSNEKRFNKIENSINQHSKIIIEQKRVK